MGATEGGRGYSADLLVNGISRSTLFPGYWTPPGTVQHVDKDSIALDTIDQYDPQQTDYAWAIDHVAEATDLDTLMGRLRTEWSSADEKFAGAFDQTYYVDYANGSDTGAGTTGDPWKTCQKVVDYVVANHLDGSDLMDESVKVILKAGVHYIDGNLDGPVVNEIARIFLNNFSGTAANQLVFAGETGDAADVIIRTSHTYLSDHWAAFPNYTSATAFHIRNDVDYIQFWDITFVGPLYEHSYKDGTGFSSAIETYNYTGGGHIDVIDCVVAQWPHAGFKGPGINLYGNYVVGNGASEHDHGIYAASPSTVDQEMIGNLFVNTWQGLHITAREGRLGAYVIVGNVLIGCAGRATHLGGTDSIYAHNLTYLSDDYGLQYNGATRNMTASNNVFYETQTSNHGDSGLYAKAIGHQLQTNGKPTATAAPTLTAGELPTVHPGAGTAMYYDDNIRQVSGDNYASYGQGTTGATAPTTTTPGDSESDGGVTWWYIGTRTESVGTWINIVDADWEDFDNYDFRPTSGSNLLSAGTDVGYGTTLGPFASAPP